MKNSLHSLDLFLLYLLNFWIHLYNIIMLYGPTELIVLCKLKLFCNTQILIFKNMIQIKYKIFSSKSQWIKLSLFQFLFWIDPIAFEHHSFFKVKVGSNNKWDLDGHLSVTDDFVVYNTCVKFTSNLHFKVEENVVHPLCQTFFKN